MKPFIFFENLFPESKRAGFRALLAALGPTIQSQAEAAPTTPAALPDIPASAEPAPKGSASDGEWYWLSSDAKYSKFFAPDSVKVVHKAKTSHGDVATTIDAWTKTSYSPGGAAETIKNYEIEAILPDPNALSYSLAQLRINPQNRTVQYLREDFYDSSDKIIWSKGPGTIKEINSRAFDESFYAAIVDEIFRQGEVDRCKDENRWITLWSGVSSSGATTAVTADTSTMRMRGVNLILWEWQETRNAARDVVEINFMKKAVNLSQGTERIMIPDSSRWTPQTGWTEYVDEMDGAYRMVETDAPEYKGLERLRAFAKGYSTWVNRYSIE